MPSKAYTTFRNQLMKDVDELIETHKQVNQVKSSKQSLGHLTRSALFILCAGWEHYIELVCTELFEPVVLDNSIESAHKAVRRILANLVKSQKDDTYCLKLIGDGWEKCLKECLDTEIKGFHTPKSTPVKNLFQEYLGVDLSGILHKDNCKFIDDFVTKRGEIAHKGAKADNPKFSEIVDYRNRICNIVMDIDEFLAEEGKKVLGKKAWQRLTESAKIIPLYDK